MAAAAVAAPVPALPLQAGALPGSNGAMRGHAPKIFNGQYKNVAKFMHKFRLWKICNVHNEAMINPFQRVALMLSYMKGPKVDDWVLQQGNRLSHHVQGNTLVVSSLALTHLNMDEILWVEFVVEFT
jgi:hypothetical protein